MAPNTDTVIALKTSFLRTQTRVLSQPLQPTQRWLERNEDAGELSESAVRGVMREGRLMSSRVVRLRVVPGRVAGSGTLY